MADMFGAPLRTFQRRAAAAEEDWRLDNRSLWQRIYTEIRKRPVVLRNELLATFYRADESVVRGILLELSDSGLVFRSGSGDRTAFRAASDEELEALGLAPLDNGNRHYVWLTIYQHKPATLDTLATVSGLPRSDVQAEVEALVAENLVSRIEDDQGSVTYTTGDARVPGGSGRRLGWSQSTTMCSRSCRRWLIA